MQFLVNTLTLLIVLINLTIGISGSCGKCHNHHQHKHRPCQETATTHPIPPIKCQPPIDPSTGKQASMSLFIHGTVEEESYPGANDASLNLNFGRTMNSLGSCFCALPTENSDLMLLNYFFSSADNSSKYINVNNCYKFCALGENGHIYSSPLFSDLYGASYSKENISPNTSSTLTPTTTQQLYVVGQGADVIIYPHCADKNQDCHVYMSFIQLYRKCLERNVCHPGETESPPLFISGTLKADDGSFWTSPKLPNNATLENDADIGFDSHYLRIVAIGCDATCDMIGKQTCDGSFIPLTECQAPSLDNGQHPIPLISDELLLTSSSLLGLFACSNWANESNVNFYTNWLRPNYTDNPEAHILVRCVSDFKNFCALSDDGKYYQLVPNYRQNTSNELSGQLFPRCNKINKGCKTFLGGYIDMYELSFPFKLVDQVLLSLKEENGSIWTSPPKETPVDANSGYLPIIAYSCSGCEAIRNLRCKTSIKTARQCDDAEIICRLKACLS